MSSRQRLFRGSSVGHTFICAFAGGGSPNCGGSRDHLPGEKLQVPTVRVEFFQPHGLKPSRTQLGTTLNIIASAYVAQLPTARSDQQDFGSMNIILFTMMAARCEEQQINWKARLAGKEALAILQSVLLLQHSQYQACKRALSRSE